ncbi:serine/threonine protein kinase [Niallia nealsonii]|uniref:Serine/threonine protein kinase n=1 Tax=Niallia nealsonii TaxID=115979 RepID=A0A2N0Z3E3_9BACI|nr:serine/threonine protein kinase [Niallia nealsonii]
MIVSTFLKIIEKPFKENKIISNRYIIRSFLGRGGYGYTYLVYDEMQKQEVVLKTLRLHKRIRKKEKKRFQQEQDILLSLNSSSFPKFYDRGFIDGSIPYFTMEFINGKTMEAWLFDEKRKWSEKQVFQFGLKLVELVDMLHKNQIVHRDIHLPNLIVANNQLKLIDFGLAKKCTREEADLFADDFFGIGQILLFLFYSSYEPGDKQKEKSWQEELQLTGEAQTLLKKLLAIEEPFRNCQQIKRALLSLK